MCLYVYYTQTTYIYTHICMRIHIYVCIYVCVHTVSHAFSSGPVGNLFLQHSPHHFHLDPTSLHLSFHTPATVSYQFSPKIPCSSTIKFWRHWPFYWLILASFSLWHSCWSFTKHLLQPSLNKVGPEQVKAGVKGGSQSSLIVWIWSNPVWWHTGQGTSVTPDLWDLVGERSARAHQVQAGDLELAGALGLKEWVCFEGTKNLFWLRNPREM